VRHAAGPQIFAAETGTNVRDRADEPVLKRSEASIEAQKPSATPSIHCRSVTSNAVAPWNRSPESAVLLSW
jgi:hypothetical protein